jgi:hypothetical protein
MQGNGADQQGSSVVLCVDGITSGMIKHFTPDVSWHAYAPWLRTRRPELAVMHMEQPQDWVELLASRPHAHGELVERMVERVQKHLNPGIRHVLILGFSLGGLTALHVASRVAHMHPDLSFDYIAFVTFGTPFKGTARLTDMLIRRLPHDYFHHMFDVELTKQHIENLLEFGMHGQLRLLIGEILNDEMVSASSSLAPVHWLTGRELPAGVKWGTFLIECGKGFRAHDGLLHSTLALAYIDGLVDGLRPPAEAQDSYEPYPGN